MTKVATVTMYAVGAPLDNPVENLQDLANQVETKLWPILEKSMTAQETEEWRGQRPMEMLSPDGDDYDKTEGTLNFYAHGMPPATLPKMEAAIRYWLAEMGAQVGDFRQETFGQRPDMAKRFPGREEQVRVVRIPVRSMTTRQRTTPYVNMSNQNAADIFEGLLNFGRGTIEGEPIEAWQVIQRADLALSMPSAQREYVSEPQTTQEPGKATWIDMGRSEEYVRGALQRIRDFAQWAVDNGHTQIYLS